MFRARVSLLLVLTMGAVAPVAADTIMVDTLVDAFPADTGDGLCSLREAVTTARDGVAVDTCPTGSSPHNIIFDPALIPAETTTPFEILLQEKLSFDSPGIARYVVVAPLERPISLVLPASLGISESAIALPSRGSLEFRNTQLMASGNGYVLGGSSDFIPLDGVELALRRCSLIGSGDAFGIGLRIFSDGHVDLELEDTSLSGFGSEAINLDLDDTALINMTGVTLNHNGTAIYADAGGGGSILWLLSQSIIENNGSEQSNPAILFFADGNTETIGFGVESSRFRANAAGGILARSFSDGLQILSISKSLFEGNASASGAVSSRGFQFRAVNNTFVDNTAFDLGPGALLVEDESGTTEIVGNSFYGNSVDPMVIDRRLDGVHTKGVIGAPLPQALRVLLADAPDNGRIVGNLIAQVDSSDEPTCVFGPIDGGSQILPTDFEFNASDVDSCLTGGNNLPIVASDVSVLSTGDEIVDKAVFPDLSSTLIDAWPDSECTFAGVLLDEDMLGERRDAMNMPLNGNEATPSGCDAGAVEMPKIPVPENIFVDGFEE